MSEYVVNSLLNQVAQSSLAIAEREGRIAELQEELNDVKEQLEKLRNEQIGEMDKEYRGAE